jgi:hypothetical protein
MANQIIIDIGAVANDGTGDPLRTAFGYVNNNFSNIWASGVANSNIQFDGNRILTTNTNGNLVLAPNGIGKVQANVDIVPNANNTLSLGSSTRQWNTVYAQNLAVGGNVEFNDLTVDGNLTVTGNTIQIGNITTETKTIQLANAASTANAANGSGVTVGADDNIATLLYSSASNVWTTNIGITATGNVAGTYFIGNGSLLTGITSYGNANVAAYLPTYTGNISANNVSANTIFSNDAYITAGTFSGDPDTGDGSLYIGSPTFTNLGTDVMAQFTGNVPSYAQINLQNYGNSNTSSGDYIITADNGTDSTHFLNLGLTGSNWDGSQPNSLGNRLGPNDGYLYVQDGDMVIGTSNGTIETWKFDQTGTLTAPGNITTTGNIDSGNVNATAIVANTVTGGNVDATDFNGGNLNNMTLGTQLLTNGQRIAGGAFDYSQLYVGFDGGDQGIALNSFGNAPVQINTGNGGANTYNWTFSNSTGEFSAPGNISATGNVTAANFIGDGSQLTGITANTANITSNVITFNTAAGIEVAAGQMAWNSSDGTLDIGLSYADVVLQVGQETHYVVRNDTGNIIENGTAVYCSGVTAGSGRIEASPMTGSTDPVKFLGLATQDISNGVNGVITYFGYVRGLDTRGTANTAISVGDETWAVGDQLYVHPTAAGKLTNVEPAAPNVKICVASIMTRNQTSGVVFVRPTSNLDMTDLSDVQITSPASDQILLYENNRWENVNFGIDIDTTPTLGGNLAGAGFNVSNVSTISATGNISGGNLITSGRVLASGNILGLNFATEGSVQASSVQATGNVSAGLYGQLGYNGNLGAWGLEATEGFYDVSLTAGDATKYTARLNNDGVFYLPETVSANVARLSSEINNADVDLVLVGGKDVRIESDGTSTNKTWTFDANGDLSAPGNISATGNVALGNLVFSSTQVQSSAYAGGNGHAMMIDTNRTDTYVANGSADKPFKTFAAAIAAVATLNPTGTVPYTFVLMGCSINEDVDFTPYNFNFITISTTCRSVFNNPVTFGNSSLLQLTVRNVEFANTVTITGDGTTNQLNNTSFYNTTFSGALTVTAANSLAFYEAAFFSTVTFNNVNYLYVNGAQFNDDLTIRADNSGPYAVPSNGITPGVSVLLDFIANDINFVKGGTGTYVFQPQSSRMGRTTESYTLPAGWTLSAYSSVFRGTWTNNGTWAMRNSSNDNAILGTAPTYNGTIGGAIVTATGNITGGNLVTAGQVVATGNVTGSNVIGQNLYATNASGNEGGEITLAKPPNGTLDGGVVIDAYVNQIRFFEQTGNVRGMYIDLPNSPPNGAAIGYRDIPQVSFTGNTTIATTDAGKHYYSTQSSNYTLTIANNASQGFQVGAAITVVNQGTGNITVAQGSGVTLYLAGNATLGNRTVSTFGMATIVKVATDTWFISGAGVA